jgi:hypothetical protein
LLFGRLTAHLKGGWPGARAAQIKGGPSNHLQGANPNDKNVVSYSKSEADYISYHAANFGENVINTTAARSQIRSVKILRADPVDQQKSYTELTQAVSWIVQYLIELLFSLNYPSDFSCNSISSPVEATAITKSHIKSQLRFGEKNIESDFCRTQNHT